jgi:opacity protein-like surface antigen
MTRSCPSSSSNRRIASIASIAMASACAFAALAFAPREAQAANYGKFDLGFDGDANALLAPSPTQNNLSTLGSGFKVRFADHFRMREGLNLAPEVGYAFDHVFAANEGVAENMNRIFAGLRVGFGRNVVPTLYAHVGYGFRSLSDNNTFGTNASIVKDSNGLALDTGVAIEFRIARHLSIGPHAEFVYIDVPNAPQWLAFGGHIDFIF